MKRRLINFLPVLTLLFMPNAVVMAQGVAIEDVGGSYQGAGHKTPPVEALKIYNSGVMLMQANKTAEAADKFKQALAIAPDFAIAACNLGTALLLQGDPAGALPYLEKAVALNPKLPPAWSTLGSCYQAVGRTKDAISALDTYLKISPNGANAAKVKGLTMALRSELKRSEGMGKGEATDYFQETTFSGLARWAKMPITVYIKSGVGVPKFRPELEDTLKQAFDDWTKASEGKVSFEFVPEPGKEKITCAFTNSLDKAISAAEGGHTMLVPDSRGGIVKADVSLLTVPLTGTELSLNYFRRVALHEIGHALGLMGHSPNPDDIMFASVLPGEHSVNLTARDTKTIQILYSDEAPKLAKTTIDVSRMASGDPNTKTNRMVKLNNDAKALMDTHNFPAAIAKLEEAHQLSPDDQVISTNLGTCYGNMAFVAMALRNFPIAETNFKKAFPLLEKGTNQMNLSLFLQKYSVLLKATNRGAEAAQVDARIKTLAQ